MAFESGKQARSAEKATGEIDGSKADVTPSSNKDVRQWYVDNVKEIRESIDPNLPIEEQALQAFNARNKLRRTARDMMADTELRQMLDETHANPTFEELIESKMKRKGMTRSEAIYDILRTATTTNANVNKELGIKG